MENLEFNNMVKRNIMKMAWALAGEKANRLGGKAVEYISFALKIVWKRVKEYKARKEAEMKQQMNQKVNSKYSIQELENMGAKKWEKGGHERLYLNKAATKMVGLEINRRRQGSIESAYYNGELISNSEAYRLNKVAKAYFDLKTGQLHIDEAETDRPEVAEVVEKLKSALN